MKDILNKYKNSKELRVIVENFFSLSFLQVAIYIFPLITVPYLARVLGVEKFGDIAFAAAIIMFLYTFTDWGFNYTATRDIAKNRNNINKISEIFSAVLWARVVLMIVSLIILLFLILFIPKFKEIGFLLFMTFSLIPGHIMYPEWLFQGLERMKYITILSLLSRVLFTILIFVFIKQKSDYYLQPLFTGLGFFLSGIISMYLILYKWQIKLLKPNFNEIYLTIKASTDVFINNLAPNLYSNFSTVLLGFWGGSVSTGNLNAGKKLSDIATQMMTVLSRAFYPYLARKINKHNMYAKFNIILAALISITLFLLAPFLINILFTKEFHGAITILRITSFSIIFASLVNIYGTNYLIIEMHQKILRNITITVSVIGFLISIPLVYYFDFIGAALSVTLTRALLGISIMRKANSIKKTIRIKEGYIT